MQDVIYKPMQSLANIVLKANKQNRDVAKGNKQLGKQTEIKGVNENNWKAAKTVVQCSVWVRAWSPVWQAPVPIAGEAGGRQQDQLPTQQRLLPRSRHKTMWKGK